MENSNLVSVIVPIYKVESYLKRCVDSLLAQTYKNIEIILVDDGSPDKCGELCDKYALKDSRIKVMHKKNGGLSDARNAGVAVANGMYIAFVDSDDYVTPDYIQYLLELLTKNHADISVCEYYRVQDKEAIFPDMEVDDGCSVFSGIEAIRLLYGKDTVKATVAWNKLYKTELVKKFPYPKGRIHEDEATTYRLFYESNCVVFGEKKCYAYYHNPLGIMGSAGARFRGDAVWAWGEQLRFYHSKEELELAQLVLNRLCSYLTIHHIENNETATLYLKKLMAWKGKEKYMSVKTKIVTMAALYCPPCYKFYCRYKANRNKEES